MTEADWPARAFEEERPRLRAVAYRMLGSTSEADDAVQEAWLRLDRSDAEAIENLGGWLTTVVARIALNMLRSRNTRREQPFDQRMPDPIVDPIDGTDPEHEALVADSVGLALLMVLETLGPAERLAFVLHDTFGVPFDEIAPIVDRSPRTTSTSLRETPAQCVRLKSLREVNLALAWGTKTSLTTQFILRAHFAAFEFLLSPMKMPITRSPSKLLTVPSQSLTRRAIDDR